MNDENGRFEHKTGLPASERTVEAKFPAERILEQDLDSKS